MMQSPRIPVNVQEGLPEVTAKLVSLNFCHRYHQVPPCVVLWSPFSGGQPGKPGLRSDLYLTSENTAFAFTYISKW